MGRGEEVVDEGAVVEVVGGAWWDGYGSLKVLDRRLLWLACAALDKIGMVMVCLIGCLALPLRACIRVGKSSLSRMYKSKRSLPKVFTSGNPSHHPSNEAPIHLSTQRLPTH